MSELLIGCHVGMHKPDYLVGSLNEAISVGANALMFYTGAPQNTLRLPVNQLNINLFREKLVATKFNPHNIFVHAPYIINLANLDHVKTKFATDFLTNELKRVHEIGVQCVIVHPGSSLNQDRQLSLQHVSDNLNVVFSQTRESIICLETMAGKGSEVGKAFQEIKFMIDHVAPKYHDRIGVCLDTCHISDAGYNLNMLDDLLHEFDQTVGLNFLKVIHLNDSKNPLGAAKDRHENIGYGTIGFDVLYQVCHHPLLVKIPKILETPYFKDEPPYQQEIKMLRDGVFNDWRKESKQVN